VKLAAGKSSRKKRLGMAGRDYLCVVGFADSYRAQGAPKTVNNIPVDFGRGVDPGESADL
jgi:hypothetical protein